MDDAEGRGDPLAGDDRRYLTVHLHRRRSETGIKARPALDIALRIRDLQGPFRQMAVAEGLMRWFVGGRIEQRDGPVVLAAGYAALGDWQAASRSLRVFRKRASLSALNAHRVVGLNIDLLLNTAENAPPRLLGRLVLGLPWQAIRSADGRRLMGTLRDQALGRAQGGGGGARGAALEVAVAADQWLSEEDCEQRLVFLGSTALTAEGQPAGEWDVVRIDLLQNGDWRVFAAESALTRSAAKDAQDREKLEKLRAGLQGRFDDLSGYAARLVHLDGDALRYVDAARGFVRT